MTTQGGDHIVAFTGEIMEHEGEEHLEEEGESSSTSAANLVIDSTKWNALEIDQTEAQSTTSVLPSSQEMVEVSTPHVSQEHSGTRLSNPTSPAPSSVRLFASAAVQGAQGEDYVNMNIDQDMMTFIPPNHHDASSQILFASQGEGVGSLMSEDNAYNNGSQQAGLGAESSSYWVLNDYQFAASNLASDHFHLPPTVLRLSNAHQAAIGVGNNQYPPSFLQTQSTDQWYPLNKINIQHPSLAPFGSERSEEIQFQGLMNQGPSNETFYSGGLSTIQFPQTRMNLQDGLPSSSNLHLSRNWISEGHGLSNSTAPPTSRAMSHSRNAVYDPTYESMGLPVDPHLRMFLARRDSTGDEI